MATIKFFKDNALPTSPSVGDEGIWFVKADGANPMKIYIINGGNVIALDAVDAATLASLLTAKADDGEVVKLTGAQSVSGVKTFNSSPKVPTANANNEAVAKGQMDNALGNKANDNEVVKKAGVQTITGKKTFTVSPEVPSADTNGEAVNKGQMDALIGALQSALNDLETAVADNMAPPTEINCSGNPNYPAAEVGDRWIVTADGKIGGASGTNVTIGDLIICKTNTSGGTQAAAGDAFFLLQTNVHDATTSVKGYIQLATQAEVNAGVNGTKAVTPNTLSARLSALATSIQNTAASVADGKYVRYDAAQGLTTAQKGTARGNIDAPKDGEVVKLAGTQTIAGGKTFTGFVRVPNAAAGPEAVNKGQLDSALGLKADKDAVVNLTGTQSVAGRKTFTVAPRSTNDASNGNDLVRKSQMDAATAAATLNWSAENWA